MVRGILNIFFALVLLGNLVVAQSGRSVDTENKRLESIKNEIEKLQTQLHSKTKLEKQSVKYLNTIEKKILLLNKYINELKREGQKNEREIRKLNKNISKVEKRQKELKELYSKYVVWYYKYGNRSKLKLFLNSGSLNEAVVRLKYFRIISDRVEGLLSDLTKNEKELKALKQRVASKLKKQKLLIAQKQKEQRNLLVSKKQKQRLLAKLRKDKNSIALQLQIKQKAEKEIESRIAALIKAEQERLAKRKADNKLPEAKYDYSGFENFNRLKGRLGWPVSYGRISRRFGKIINPKLKTVSLNYGIDIKTKKNASVRAVAGGIVSKIDWLPGYGSVIIITHKNNFRTVYGHVTDITVNEGDRVNAGTVLGKVDDSLEGYVLHFEIWKSRQYQNPTRWLARR